MKKLCSQKSLLMFVILFIIVFLSSRSRRAIKKKFFCLHSDFFHILISLLPLFKFLSYEKWYLALVVCWHFSFPFSFNGHGNSNGILIFIFACFSTMRVEIEFNYGLSSRYVPGGRGEDRENGFQLISLASSSIHAQ